MTEVPRTEGTEAPKSRTREVVDLIKPESVDPAALPKNTALLASAAKIGRTRRTTQAEMRAREVQLAADAELAAEEALQTKMAKTGLV